MKRGPCRWCSVSKLKSDELLRAHSAELPQKVAAIIEGKFQPAALAQLVSSQLDVDRMDYLLRDSLMTGAKYGIYDLEWIINALAIDEEGDRIYVAARGLYAVEEYLQARYYMFRQVYFHRTLRSAEAVLAFDPASRACATWKRANRFGMRRTLRSKKCYAKRTADDQ